MLVAYSFIAPNFIGFAVFTLGPILFAFALAFLHWDGSNPIEFAGLDNFCAPARDRHLRHRVLEHHPLHRHSPCR